MSDLGQTLTRFEIAERQLDRALELFLEHDDYPCAITLAGASEEILGKLLELEGREHSLEEFIQTCVVAGKQTYGKDWSGRTFASMANYFRNGLKHLTDEHPLTIPREAAVEILDRAISNYWKLAGKETRKIREFIESVHGL